MDVKDIKRLMDAMAAADLSELEFERRDGEGPATVRVRLRRGSRTPAPSPGPAAPASGSPAGGAAASSDAPVAVPAPSSGAPAPTARKEADHLHDVTAPIVGTFYASPSPDAAPFVKVGDRVQRGTVMCIIEAMKLMNEIEAEVAGTVAEVLVQNEDPVEYGQVLFRIDPG